jgi:hypothetical protein
MIYFIQGKCLRKIKIGFTDSSIESRMSPMISSSPDELIFLGGLSGDRTIEKSIQNLFESNHSHGEWYFENDDLLSFIKRNCIVDMECLQIVNDFVSRGKIDFKEALELTMSEIKKMELDHIRVCCKRMMPRPKEQEIKAKSQDELGFNWVYSTDEYIKRWLSNK